MSEINCPTLTWRASFFTLTLTRLVAWRESAYRGAQKHPIHFLSFNMELDQLKKICKIYKNIEKLNETYKNWNEYILSSLNFVESSPLAGYEINLLFFFSLRNPVFFRNILQQNKWKARSLSSPVILFSPYEFIKTFCNICNTMTLDLLLLIPQVMSRHN